MTSEEKNSFGGAIDLGSSYKVQDTNKGMLFTARNIKLMEFLFYKKDIGPGSEKFFTRVKELFLKKCGIKTGDDSETIRTKIVDAVKKMKGATAVKAIFKTAMDELLKEDLSITRTELENPNTTALCMLHRNLPGILNLVGVNWRVDRPSFWHRVNSSCSPKIIRKIGELRQEHPMQPFGRDWCDYWYYHGRNRRERFFVFPNTMLTSDAFLLSKAEVDAFVNKYQHYYDDFWLFQIPHHGSEKNSDKLLLSQFATWKSNFINYGVSNTFGHPDMRLLMDVVATGHSERLIPVNELQGVTFGIKLEREW